MICNGYVADRIAVSQGLAITYKMYVQQPTKTFCNFMQKRLAKNKEEITFDEIYSLIEAKPEVLDRYKAIEKQVELDVCIRNLELYQVYEECIRQGKRVIITSDMYLPTEIIEEILHKNGYNGYSKLYLSSDIGKTKASGSLYRYVAENEKVKPNQIIHFGDNIRSDIKNAIKAGLHTCHIQKKEKKSAIDFDAQTLSNFIRYSNDKNDIYESVGYSALGPMLYGFIDWIKKSVADSKIEKLFFLSRDGFIMNQVYDRIKTDSDVTAQYMYASRRALQVAAIHLNPDYEDVMTSMFLPRTVTVSWLIKKWGLKENDFVNEVEKLGLNMNDSFSGKAVLGNSKLQNLYDELKNKILFNSQKEYDAFIKYLDSISFSGKVAIVDIGWYGNMQNALMKIIKSSNIHVDITGYYLGIVPESDYQDKYQMNGYLFMKNKNEDLFWRFKYLNSLMELFFMAPHGSAKRYYIENNLPEVELADFEFEGTETLECIKKVQKSALEFVSIYHNSMAKYIDNNADTYLHNMLSMFMSPTLKIAEAFGELAIWDEKWIKIAPAPRVLSAKSDFLNVSWKNGYLKRLLKLPLKYDKILLFLRSLKSAKSLN